MERLEAPLEGARASHAVGCHRFGKSLKLERSQFLVFEQIAQKTAGRRSDYNGTGFGKCL